MPGAGALAFILLAYLAALQDVPRDLLEAADLDGASNTQKVRHVTLPMISPVILFNVITGLIAAFQLFTQVHVMTDGTGSPADSTLMISIYLWQSAFQFFKMGYASSMAVIVMILIFVAEPQDTLDSGAVVPTAVEQHDLSRRGKMSDIPLKIEL